MVEGEVEIKPNTKSLKNGSQQKEVSRKRGFGERRYTYIWLGDRKCSRLMFNKIQ